MFVLRGNIAVLRCQMPSSVRSSLQVLSWLKDEPILGRSAVHPGGRYTITSSGTLHIHDTVKEDSHARFYCQTMHKLTGERRLSQPGQIIVTGQ